MRGLIRRAFMLSLALAGCGGGGAGTVEDDTDGAMLPGEDGPAGPAPDAGPCPTEGRYFPLAQGATWTYEVRDPSVETKTTTVGPLEDVGGSKAGTMAFRVTTTKTGGSTVSWQQDTGSAILRHREQDLSGVTHTEEWFDPYKLRIDEAPAHITPSASWAESYIETATEIGTGNTTTTSKTEEWTVVAVDEVVAVPAGTFCALRLRRLSASSGAGASDKTFWFARGVGKIKETGSQTEQLTSYSLP